MRFITLFALGSLLVTTSALPIVYRRAAILETTSLGDDTPSATTLGVVASATDINTDVDPSSLPTATSDSSLTDSSDLASATATNAPTLVVSSSDPTITDPPDVSSSVDLLSASATPTDTSNGTDISATATDSSTATATVSASASVTFVIPTVPTACVARFGDSSLTASSTLSADPSQNTTFTDPSIPTTSDNSTVTDTSSSANDTETATESLSASATATASASDSGTASASASASTVSATASDSDSTDLPQPTGALALVSVNPNTVTKRIAQEDLPDVAQTWQDLCLVSNGDIFSAEPCVNLAGVDGINALLANADPCDQQDNADAMIDYAKSPGVTNTDELIANAIAYRKHPRNALNIEGIIPSTPYCQKAPRNAELVGIVNDQLPGVNPGIFGGPSFGLVAFGDPSSCPFGTSPNVDTCECE